MRPFQPLLAIGWLVRSGAPLGTCFAFHKSPFFLTAAHCVGEAPAGELGILLPRHNEHMVRVESVAVHPEADVALLRADQTYLDVDPFWSAGRHVALGDDFATYGYPESPEPQFLKGYVQRMTDRQSHMGYRYLACEISTPIAVGMSGAPLFDPEDFGRVLAVAAESVEHGLDIRTVEERIRDGHSERVESARVVTYGIGVLLWPLSDWLSSLMGELHRGG